MSHAYIITAETYTLCREAAINIAAEKACSNLASAPCRVCKNCRKIYGNIHPDVVFISRAPDKTSGDILVDTIRDVVYDARVIPNEADCKVYIFEGTMNKASQNAILKLLEEGPSYCIFIICTTNAGLLLPTVRSRCVEVDASDAYNPKSSEMPEASEALTSAVSYLSLAGGKDKTALLRFCLEHEAFELSRLVSFAGSVKSVLSRCLCKRERLPGISEAKAHKLLELMKTIDAYLEFNVNPKHIWGVIAAKTIES